MCVLLFADQSNYIVLSFIRQGSIRLTSDKVTDRKLSIESEINRHELVHSILYSKHIKCELSCFKIPLQECIVVSK